MADEQSSKHFFTTLPGIITAVAALITAVGGFILILNKTGCAGPKAIDDEQTEQVAKDTSKKKLDDKNKGNEDTATINKSNVSYSPAIVKHLTRNLVYKIEEASAVTMPDGQIVFNLKLNAPIIPTTNILSIRTISAPK